MSDFQLLKPATAGLRTKHIPLPDRLLGRMLYRGYMTVLAGDPGIGKSFLVSTTCLAAVTPSLRIPGLEPAGIDNPLDDTPLPLRVAIVANDQTLNTFDERLQSALLHYGADDDRLPKNLMLHTIDDGPLVVGEWASGSFVVTSEGNRLLKELELFRPDVVIFEPIHDNIAIDQGDNSQWLRAAEYDATVRQHMGTTEWRPPATLWVMHTLKDVWGKPLTQLADIRAAGAVIGKSMVAVTLSVLDDNEMRLYGINPRDKAKVDRFKMLRQLRNNLEEKDHNRLVIREEGKTVSGAKSAVAVIVNDAEAASFRALAEFAVQPANGSVSSMEPLDGRTQALHNLAYALRDLEGHCLSGVRRIRVAMSCQTREALDIIASLSLKPAVLTVPGLNTVRLRTVKAEQTWSVEMESITPPNSDGPPTTAGPVNGIAPPLLTSR